MARDILTTIVRAIFVALLTCGWVQAQQQGITAGGALGSGTQGSRLGSSTSGSAAAQGGSSLSLSQRFQSNQNRFTQGSQGLGQTTAGMTAAQGVFGGGAGGLGQSFGRGGIGNQLLGLGALGAFGGGRGRNMFGAGGLGQQQQQQQGNRQVRTHVVIGFTHPLQDPANAAQVRKLRSRVLNRIDRMLQRALRERAAGVQLRLEGSTAVLVGSVASDHQKELAERLVKLEPGIESVRNELTVDRGGSTP